MRKESDVSRTVRFVFFGVFIVCISLGAGCAKLNTSVETTATIPVREAVDDKIAGAAVWHGQMNVKNSPYYPSHDYFRSSPTKSLVKLDGFKTYQQTSGHSCGAACALMALEHFGIIGISEKQLDRELDIRASGNRRSDGGYGCTPAALVKMFRARGFAVKSSLDAPNKDGTTFETAEKFSKFLLDSLHSDSVVLLENITWGGHWVVLVGYDTMGTENCGDDVLIFADPYDTSDHCQDGYCIKSFERFFYEWFDGGILAPGITRQQFVAVSRK